MKGTQIIAPYAPKLSSLIYDAVKIAKEIGYSEQVVEKINRAMNQSEINRILRDARHEWDVDPGRWFGDMGR